MNTIFLIICFLYSAGSAIDPRINPQDQTKKSAPAAEAYQWITTDTSIVILDVRTKEEFNGETGHLKNALLIPVQELEKRMEELVPFKERTILVYCRSGRRSSQATDLLLKNGYHSVNLEGGILRWNEEKLPTVKEK